MNTSKARTALLLAGIFPASAFAAGGGKPMVLDPLIFDAGLKEAKPEGWQGVTKKTPTTTHYFLPTGFTFPVRLQNAIYSYNVASPAICIVEKEVQYQHKVALPPGTQIIGTVSVQQDHDRILATFHTIVFPDGEEIKFTGLGLSLDGSLGIKGKVETHKDSAVANTVLRALITGTQGALVASGVSPIAAGATQGLSGEATKELDTQREQVVTSISVDADAGLRIYLPQRIEY
jgi:type IV secretory pathway VirB10-like protein